MIGTYEYPLGPSYIEYKKEKSENGECSVSICGLGPGFKNLVIPSEINGFPVYKIDTGAFLDYDRLQSVTFPDTLKIIGQSAFEDCDGLKSISFPPSLYEIGTKAFSDCQNLASVVFNEGLHAIKYDAFYSCKIKSLKFQMVMVQIFHSMRSIKVIYHIVNIFSQKQEPMRFSIVAFPHNTINKFILYIILK